MPHKSSSYHKRNRKPEFQLHLSQNYDFVFTNLVNKVLGIARSKKYGSWTQTKIFKRTYMYLHAKS
jgi:hypothetical protein